MTTGPSVEHLFGNSSKPPAFNPPTAPKTGHTSGNAPHPPTPTYHPGPFYSCAQSPNDSDGKPNTPPRNSLRITKHTTTVRQQAMKRPEETVMEKDERLWTPEDLANYLGIPVQTLYQWRRKGTGPKGRRVGRHLRYDPAVVRRWFEALDEAA
jgi:predicted DNA-binding transcriptional regulator AlpA